MTKKLIKHLFGDNSPNKGYFWLNGVGGFLGICLGMTLPEIAYSESGMQKQRNLPEHNISRSYAQGRRSDFQFCVRQYQQQGYTASQAMGNCREVQRNQAPEKYPPRRSDFQFCVRQYQQQGYTASQAMGNCRDIQ